MSSRLIVVSSFDIPRLYWIFFLLSRTSRSRFFTISIYLYVYFIRRSRVCGRFSRTYSTALTSSVIFPSGTYGSLSGACQPLFSWLKRGRGLRLSFSICFYFNFNCLIWRFAGSISRLILSISARSYSSESYSL